MVDAFHPRIEAARRRLCAMALPESYYDGAAKVCRDFPRKFPYWDRGLGLRVTARYLDAFLLELYEPEPFGLAGPLRILDLGPGAGHLMEYAREAGHVVEGVDCYPGGEGVQGYKMMAEARGLSVAYVGFHAVMLDRDVTWAPSPDGYHLIHASKSLGGIVSCHESALPEIPARRSKPFLDFCHGLLVPGGLLHLSHNAYDGLPAFCLEMSEHPGYRHEQLDKHNTRHWRI
jgi:hypothetical protein